MRFERHPFEEMRTHISIVLFIGATLVGAFAGKKRNEIDAE